MNNLITIKYESTLFIILTVTFKLIYSDFNILFYTGLNQMVRKLLYSFLLLNVSL